MKRAILITSLLILFIGCKKVEIENEDYEQFKETEMAVLPETDITTTVVGNTLGTSSRNVGVLCTHPNINPNAKNKPASLVAPGSGYIEGNSVKSHGIYRTGKGATLYYNKPKGGALNPYRLGDFRGYNHLIGKPTSIVINSVKDITYGVSGAPTLSPPYQLYPSFVYRIQLSMLRGGIDPSTICAETVWDKKTGSGGQGAGGVGLVRSSTSENDVIDASQVFDGGAIIDFMNVSDSGSPLRFHYMKRDYEPIIGEEWRSTGYEIENDDYKVLFQGASLGLSTTANIFYFVDTEIISFSGKVSTSTGYSVPYKVELSYRVNNGSWRALSPKTGTSNSTPSDSWNDTIPFTYFEPGSNLCEGRAALYLKNPDGSYTFEVYEYASRTITRPF